MSNYHRVRTPGGTWFFTVNLSHRGSDLLVREIERPRAAASAVRRRYPFTLEAAVVLPDHLHAIMRLPAGDSDFPLRWRYFKTLFVRSLPATEPIALNRQRRGERGIWQRRYWEHLIRDQRDFEAHLDYVHFKPITHGLVNRVRDWPHSSFHRYVKTGVLPIDWGGDQSALVSVDWGEQNEIAKSCRVHLDAPS
ncbi:MAG: transposase [Paracoccaceae bacterium]|nr:transposase [Paracoccaceae bacterium]